MTLSKGLGKSQENSTQNFAQNLQNPKKSQQEITPPITQLI